MSYTVIQIPKPYKSLDILPVSKYDGFDLPFAPTITKIDQDNNEITIKISLYSDILQSMQIDDRLFILGLDTPLTIKYPEKIWLEIFFDTNRNPVLGIIRHDSKWRASYTTNSISQTKQFVYPNIIDLITYLDINDRNLELQTIQTEIAILKQDYNDQIDNLVKSGFYTAEEGNNIKDQYNTNYDKFNNIFNQYLGDMNNFFNGYDGFIKKQFRLYVPLVYTTKNLTDKIQGQVVNAGQIDKSQNNINIKSDVQKIKVIAAQTTNLLLINAAYINLYPVKIVIPYQKPVYSFLIKGDEEEDTIT